jgi:tetratricopeptide (TPR) repeat protein
MSGFHRLAAPVLALAFLASNAAAADDAYQEATRLHKEGNRAAALSRLDEHLAARPRDARARFLLGVILAEESRSQEAIEVFTALTQDFPELPEPHNNLAVLYAARGEYERARQELEMAIRADPGYAVAHENLGDIYATLASQAYDKAVSLDAKNAAARTKLALIRELFAATGGPATAKAPETGPATAGAGPETPAAAAEPVAASGTQARVAAAMPPAQASLPAESAAEDQPAAVLKTVEGWARAWSNKEVDAYLAFYAQDFRTPKGEPRRTWEAARRSMLTKPRRIRVDVVAPKVSFQNANRATVTFRQNYSADAYKSSLRKTLVLVRQGERWLIQQEIVRK